jgi:hypothetical protein
MEDKKNNPAVKDELTNNNFEDMNKIDFSKVYGEETVTKTTAVDQQEVNRLFNAFINLPSSVEVKFQNIKGYLYMNVVMTFKGNHKYYYNYQTYADFKLVEKMLCSMANPKMTGCLGGYKAEEHPLEASESDPRVELFRQFMKSKFKCCFGKDFKPNEEESYVCATFQVGFRKEVKFCLKRTEEIEAIINDAMKVA